MTINVGQTYKFTFTTPFIALNGIYTVTQAVPFDGAIANGVNFVNDLYVPAGLTKDAYNTDWKNYANDTVYKLVSVLDTSVYIQAPMSVFALIPDPMVRQYYNIFLGIAIGPMLTPDTLTPLVTEINDLVSSYTGTTNTCQLMTMNPASVWMTDADYATLQQQRQQNIKAIQPLTVTNLSQQQLIDSLRTEIAALKTFILSQTAQSKGGS